MQRRCVVLLSGGLDSMLAVRLMQEQRVEVEALNFKTTFTCCQDDAAGAARRLGVRLTVVGQEDDYLDLVKRPKFGYGKGANPCIDCRIYMFQRARTFMESIGADFLVSGEVAGQRPKSQKRRDLDAIARHADLEDRLLRPLSAKLLPPTLPEREGWVNREQLFEFSGRGRKGLIRLAQQLGIETIPSPSTGCRLTEPHFSSMVFDLVEIDPEAGRWEFQLLNLGRHYRISRQTKIVVGRDEGENEALTRMAERRDAPATALVTPRNFTGPCALVTGESDEAVIDEAARLVLRYGKPPAEEWPQVDVTGQSPRESRHIRNDADDPLPESIAARVRTRKQIRRELAATE